MTNPTSPVCATCRFFKLPIVEIPNGQGSCRRYPKAVYSYTVWPFVEQDDWCGEHEPIKENDQC